jgi:hypothetical protein
MGNLWSFVISIIVGVAEKHDFAIYSEKFRNISDFTKNGIRTPI